MIARSSIATEYVVVFRTTDQMSILRYKGKVISSRQLLLREETYYSVRHRTVMNLQQIKETNIEIRTQIMVRTTKKDGEVEPRRLNPDSSKGIYVTASVEADLHMRAL